MEGKFECWVNVPGTDGRFAVSNLGHCLRVGKKRRRRRETLVLLVNEDVPLVADYKTGELGWYAYFDGESNFFRRDDLMRLFPEGLADVDRSHDAEAIEKRERTYIPDIVAKTKPAAAGQTEDPESGPFDNPGRPTVHSLP